MPTYQYRCRDCNTDLEVVQKFTDDALTECPSCEDGTLRKVFNAVGVVFKGSGFYRTDSRSTTDSRGTTDASAPAKASTPEKTESKGASSKEPAKAGASTGASSSD